MTNEVSINSEIYKGAEQYAKLHNISVIDTIEKAVLLFLQKLQPTHGEKDSMKFEEVVSYVKTLAAKGGKPVPADENGLEALVETKYKL